MRTFVILVLLVFAGRADVAGQDLLNVAKDLYAAAAYDDALATLNRVARSGPEVARQADEYRTFCLFALGRTRDAESVAESIVRKAPLVPLSGPDVSPRVEAMFTTVRQRLWPTLVRDRMAAARAALDRQDFFIAEPLLIEVQLMVREAARLGVTDEALGDLNILADGFLQIVRSATRQRMRPVSSVAIGLSMPSRVPVVPIQPRFYSSGDKDVVPPVVLEQAMPDLPRDLIMIAQAWKVSGVLRVAIDESGRVVGASVNRALDPGTQELIVGSARQWKYLPATRDGVPVPYMKTIALIP